MAKSAPGIDRLMKKYKPRLAWYHNGPRCRLEVLGPKADTMARGLRERGVGYAEIARILEAEFHKPVGHHVIQRHIRGECRCGRG